MLGDLGESSGRWGLALDRMLSGSRVILIGYLHKSSLEVGGDTKGG